jgi:hypothetical protein
MAYPDAGKGPLRDEASYTFAEKLNPEREFLCRFSQDL